jgi:hypothetical protein
MNNLPVEVAELIRAKIKAGHVPGSPNSRIFTSRGAGYPCSCCGRSIRSHEPEYEVESLPLDQNALCVMHRNCYLQWREIVGVPSGGFPYAQQVNMAPLQELPSALE